MLATAGVPASKIEVEGAFDPEAIVAADLGPIGEKIRATEDGPPSRELPWRMETRNARVLAHRIVEVESKKHLIIHIGGAHGDMAYQAVRYVLANEPAFARVNMYGSAGSFSERISPDTFVILSGAIRSAESDRAPVPISNRARLDGAIEVSHSNVSTLLREHRAGLARLTGLRGSRRAGNFSGCPRDRIGWGVRGRAAPGRRSQSSSNSRRRSRATRSPRNSLRPRRISTVPLTRTLPDCTSIFACPPEETTAASLRNWPSPIGLSPSTFTARRSMGRARLSRACVPVKLCYHGPGLARREETMLGRILAIQTIKQLFDGFHFLRDVVEGTREDRDFFRAAFRAFVPPFRNRSGADPKAAAGLFALGPEAPPPASLKGLRIGLAASGGSGALASVVGVAAALEEAGARPAAYAACSGSALFAAPLAAGLSARETAEWCLGWRPCDLVDPDYLGLARALLTRGIGFSGLLKGDALEALFRARFGKLKLGDLPFPYTTVAWEVDRNMVRVLGTRETPHMELAAAVRTAIAIPLFIRTTPFEGHQLADGGIVNIFPVSSLRAYGPFDRIVGVNCFYPRAFEGEDVTGWLERPHPILWASAQLRSCQHIELARREVAEAGPALWLIHPLSHTEIRGMRFYEHFLSNASWPRFIREGFLAARAFLARATASKAAGSSA